MNWKTLAAALLGFGLVWVSGCDAKKDAPKPDNKKHEDEDDHDHDGPGPHGGTAATSGRSRSRRRSDGAENKKAHRRGSAAATRTRPLSAPRPASGTRRTSNRPSRSPGGIRSTAKTVGNSDLAECPEPARE